jgi:hypothetical protein
MARTVIQIAADPSYLDALCNDGQIFRLVNHVWQPMAPIPQDDQRETGSRPARIYPRSPPDQPSDLPTAKDCRALIPNLSADFISAQISSLGCGATSGRPGERLLLRRKRPHNAESAGRARHRGARRGGMAGGVAGVPVVGFLNGGSADMSADRGRAFRSVANAENRYHPQLS